MVEFVRNTNTGELEAWKNGRKVGNIETFNENNEPNYTQCIGCIFCWDDMYDTDVCVKYQSGKPESIIDGSRRCQYRKEGTEGVG